MITVIRLAAQTAFLALALALASTCWGDFFAIPIGLLLAFSFGWRFGKIRGVTVSALAVVLLIIEFGDGFDFTKLTLLGSLYFDRCDASEGMLVQLLLLLLTIPIVASFLKPRLIAALSNAGYRLTRANRFRWPGPSWFLRNSAVVKGYQATRVWLHSDSTPKLARAFFFVAVFLSVQAAALKGYFDVITEIISVPTGMWSGVFIVMAALYGRAIVPIIAITYISVLLFAAIFWDLDSVELQYWLVGTIFTSVSAWIAGDLAARLAPRSGKRVCAYASKNYTSLWVLTAILPLLFAYSFGHNPDQQYDEFFGLASGGVLLYPFALIPILLTLNYRLSHNMLSNIALLFFLALALFGVNFPSSSYVQLQDFTIFDLGMVTLMPLAFNRLDCRLIGNARFVAYFGILFWCLSPMIYGDDPRWMARRDIDSEVLQLLGHFGIAELIARTLVWTNRGVRHEQS